MSPQLLSFFHNLYLQIMLSNSFKNLIKYVEIHGLIFFLIVAVFSINGFAKSFIALIEADLDLDGKTERIELNSENDFALQVKHGGKLMWEGVPSRWNPWKLEIADVDGDGKHEIIIGIIKSTKFFPKPHNCLFIYDWKNGHAFPKWLGSSLGKPFTDFLFADLDNMVGDELIALETNLDGKKSLAVYRWNSFGFTLDWQYGNWQTAKILGVKNGQISLETDEKSIFLSMDLVRNKL